jgi:hypothetical protein
MRAKHRCRILQGPRHDRPVSLVEKPAFFQMQTSCSSGVSCAGTSRNPTIPTRRVMLRERLDRFQSKDKPVALRLLASNGVNRKRAALDG